MTFSNTDGYIYGFLLIRLVLLYISSLITSNIMNQIYSERVLIVGRDPPPLNYQIYLFIVIDVLLNLFLIGFVWGVVQIRDGIDNTTTRDYVIQYVVSLIVIVIISLIISLVMYDKKYFLYKDDGLRGIRALQIILFRSGAVISLIPFYKICFK
jgi:hypothetical protein